MKRYSCHQHAFRYYDKDVTISKDKCTLCRWEKRPYTLPDIARELEYISENMREAAEHEYYDPFGFTYAPAFNDIIIQWYKSMHESYRTPAIEKLLKEIDYKPKDSN